MTTPATRPINDPNLPPTPPANENTPAPTPAPAPTPNPAPAPTPAPEPDPLHVTPQEALATTINERITKARLEEKTKVHTQIERANARAEAATKQAETLAQSVERLTKENEKLRTGAPNPTPNPAPTPAPATGISETQLNAAIEAALNKASEAYEPQIKQLQSELDKRDLDAYRISLIEANKDSIIAELVRGSTREELDNSLVLAKQSYATVAAKLRPTQNGNPAPGNAAPAQPTPTPVPAVPPTPALNPGQNGSPSVPGQVGLTDVKRMSDADYLKNRKQILAEASAAAKKVIAENTV